MTPTQKSAIFEDRLIDFAVRVLTLAETLPHCYTGRHLAQQLIRSSTAPALLYAEARGAESTRDFIHKINVANKELRETFVNLKIIERKQLVPSVRLAEIKDENNQLIAIMVSTVRTSRKRARA